ncbi:helix-turn-helix transcriptional regulator [Roseateles sp.]|uniref:helix-turn-helix domain-containing protein n=1 Tax=Roseateles sp. TaxID=1971397 RepID=UPI0031E38B9B
MENTLDSIAKRFSYAMAQSELSINEFARRAETSAGFVSEVLRGLKRPGLGLLEAAHRELGVSLNWLVAGEGAIYAAPPLDVEKFRAKRLEVALAKAAVVDGDAVAKRLLSSKGHWAATDTEAADSSLRALLEKLARVDPVLEVTLELFNAQADADMPTTLLAAAQAFEATMLEADRFMQRLPRGTP